MKPEIQLKSRYGVDNKLVRVDTDSSVFYKLITPHNCRVGISEEDPYKCTFVDPSGGPFIDIGYEIDGHKVKAIHAGFIIELES